MIINKLKELEKQRPTDVLIKYSIAMEYLKMEQTENALRYFSDLEVHFPDYLPTYYMYGNLLVETGNEHLAQSIYKKGMNLAKEQQNTKTYHELEQALFLL